MEDTSNGKTNSNTEKLDEWLSNNAILVLFGVLGIAFLISVLITGAYILNFYSHPISDNSGNWGEFGDFLGGALNPVFGFLSVIAILAALVVQSRELKISSAELRNSAKALQAQNLAIEHQSFEQTFFAWLNNYHELLQSTTHVNNTNHSEIHGRITLYAWWGPERTSHLPYGFMQKKISDPGKYNQWTDSLRGNQAQRLHAAIQSISESNELTEFVLNAWENIYLSHEYQLDSLFRNLYRFLLWIHSHGQLSAAQKWLYISIVRGQLSWIEQVYLFYNGLTERGTKFKSLINTYALFDNLTFENDPVLEHIKTYSPLARSYEESAFDSLLARHKLGLPDSAEETMALAAAITNKAKECNKDSPTNS